MTSHDTEPAREGREAPELVVGAGGWRVNGLRARGSWRIVSPGMRRSDSERSECPRAGCVESRAERAQSLVTGEQVTSEERRVQEEREPGTEKQSTGASSMDHERKNGC